jgi:hypothetical protein
MPGVAWVAAVSACSSAWAAVADRQWFTDAFANQEDISPESAATLVVCLASGAADVLSGRNIDVSDDVAQMVARAAEIEQRDLHVLRERE